MKIPANYLRRLAAALLLLPASMAAGVNVSGTVYESRRGRLVPLARVKVQAHTPKRSELFAATRTGRHGRYLLTGLPSERFLLTASRVGYFTQKAGAHEGERVVLDCSQPEDCAAVDFVMMRAGVVSGRVVDEFGDPLQEINVLAHKLNADGRSDASRWRNSDFTDDRGAFRIHSLPPGRYRLETEIFRRREAAPRHGQPLEVEIEAGDEVTGLQITLTREPLTTFRVSGKVQGVDLTREGVHFVGLQPARTRRRGIFATRSHSVGPDGAFLFTGVEAGSYRFFYMHRTNAYGEGRQPVLLDVLEVKTDLSGLILRPAEAAEVRGAVRFETQPAAAPLTVWFTPKDDQGERSWLTVEPPDFEFEAEKLLPGSYEVRIRPRSRDDHFYLKGLRKGSDIDRSRLIHLTAGATESLELVVASDFSRVSGRVKAPADPPQQGEIQAGAQFWVALKGPDGVRSVQTDQHGRFFFDNVVPGEQQIGAWAELSRQAAREDAFWEEVEEVVRRFVAEEGSEIEIDLTAAP